MAENEASLSELFKQATSTQDSLDEIDSRSIDFKQRLQSCIDILKQCIQLVDRLALFSVNEDLEDISTINIQYLSIDYLLSELTLRSYSPTDRLNQLDAAATHLGDFLSRLDEYSLLNSSEKLLLEAYKESQKNFRLVSESAGMEVKRNIKIKRFQEEKNLKSRLKLFREQSQSLNVDDEVIRRLYLAELSLFAHQAFQSLDLINQERQILASIPSQPDPTHTANDERIQARSDERDRRNGTHNGQAYSDRLDSADLAQGSQHKSILDSSGRPLQPFTITSKRTDTRKGVFRPGHSLPTMSIDEYLEEEHRRGGISDGGGPKSEIVKLPDEDDVDAVDRATIDARQWDKYVEENPKGSGNTLNRG